MESKEEIFSKECSKCKEEKLANEFAPDKRRPHGLQSQCRECQNKWKEENLERIKKINQEKFIKNGGFKRKICSVCKLEKEPEEFAPDKRLTSGLQSRCRKCQKKWREEPQNKKNIIATSKKWREENKEERKKWRKQYYQENREEELEKGKAWRKENKKYMREYNKKWKEENPDYVKQYRQENREHLNELARIRSRKDRRENPEKYKKHRRRYYNNKKDDPIWILRKNISGIIYNALKRNKGGKNGESILKYLPYTIEQLREHLESQFEGWMTWENHGVYIYNGPKTWHIDHIIPQSELLYDSMTHPNFQKCWALSNLRPLEAIANIKKSNKS